MSTVVSKSARKSRAAAAMRGTIAADHRIVIRDAPALDAVFIEPGRQPVDELDLANEFTKEEFATMPLVVRATAAGSRAEVWRTGDGRWWRSGGGLSIRLLEGVRSYVITLHKGANEDDLKWLQKRVTAMRSGKGLGHAWRRSARDGADKKTFYLTYLSRPYGDPYRNGDRAGRIFVCDEPKCMHQWHVEDRAHVLDEVHRELNDGHVKYSIEVRKNTPPVSGIKGWYVDAHTDEFYGSPEDVTRFVSDLQWMQEACRRANQSVESMSAADAEAAA